MRILLWLATEYDIKTDSQTNNTIDIGSTIEKIEVFRALFF